MLTSQWLLCVNYFTSLVSLTGFYTKYEPSIVNPCMIPSPQLMKTNLINYSSCNDAFVNRVYEKIMEKLKELGQQVTGVKRKIGNWAKGVALQGNMNLEQG